MKRLLAGAALALLALATGVAAQERITAFHSDVRIDASGELTVVETIEVEAQGQAIKRGILRDFPTDYRDRAGNRVTVPFDVAGVQRDGAPEQFATESLSNGVRVRIGRAEVMLPPGRHTYTITYRTARQLGFFAQHDELYWNVTGSGWTFAIDQATARVTLPRRVPAADLSAEAYTGPQGAQGRDWRAQVVDGGAEYATTRALAPREGLTVVLMFPKGIVPEPGAAERAGWFLAANRAAGAGGLGVLLVGTWLYSRWRRVGRDPKAGPLFPRYEPPPGVSPAALRFIDKMGFDHRCFAAGILGLGARGYLKVDQHGEAFEVQRTGRSVDWLAGERPLADALFSGRNATTISQTYDPKIAAAQGALSAALKQHYKGVLFSRNGGSIAVGIALAVATAAVCVMLDAPVVVMAATLVSLMAMLVAFNRWMPSYTVEGRKLKDHIEGLRQYLGVAERQNLAQLKAPELTPQEFARMLPYALALDVEKTWADRFAAVAGSAAVAAAVAEYYHSDSGDGFGSMGDLGASLGDLGDAVSSAATAPGSSSGSGGGGSSGGGGGGGGGSGW
ncbi:MAG: DUF2207 domain-containing protein [Burkholderiaceae bacterium]|nr:DUF2207 domain-containing protein [Burkholderiaceae bacterium]